MAQEEPWTIGRLLEWTTAYLKGQGADSPRLDAEVLLAHVRRCRRIELYTAFAEVASEAERTAFRELVRKRASGTPVAYLVGSKEFYSLSFSVTPEVLIPRPESELLVVRLLDLAANRGGATLNVLDVGTGSGILAVCAAKYLKAAIVHAVDVSPGALRVAADNAARHGVSDRVNFVRSDLLSSLPSDLAFDFIVSNPPYISSAEMAELTADVRDYEPRQSLEAGPLGTEVVKRLIPQAAGRLLPDGWLLIETSPQQATAVEELLSQEPKLEPSATFKDLAGHPRVVQARRRA